MKKLRVPKSVAKQFKKLSALRGKLAVQLKKTEVQAKQVDKRLTVYTKRYPRKALLMAAGAGAAMGIGAAMLFRRKKKKRR